ncbi:MAG: chemotaxis protein CheW [Coriobacteriia bacterium]|nr:chemotaxis protein CheW [Coriobacteriia bacterium]
MGTEEAKTAEGEPRQFVSFDLDDETFALEVSRVREILDWSDITRVPRMPAFMRGVMNVRGSVIPVVDLRVKFGMAPVEPTADTCVLVAEVAVDGELTVVGAMVDKVREVFEVLPDAMEPPPRMGAKLDTEFIEALVRHEDQVLIALDIDHVLSVDEVIAIRKAGVAEADRDAGDRPSRGRKPRSKGAGGSRS